MSHLSRGRIDLSRTDAQLLQSFDDFVVSRCRDPNGHQIEVYWE